MLNELIERYPCLVSCKEEIRQAAEALINCYAKGRKVMICGNGGSCADADHIVGELMKGFLKKRPISGAQRQTMKNNCSALDDSILDALQCGLPAISLCSTTALNTAFANDVDPSLIYAQNVFGLGKQGDILLCISTSGNANNVYAAAKVAKALGITVIGLTGGTGGLLKDISDICIIAPGTHTYKIQELHLPIYHFLCAATEAHFFGE